MNGITNRYVTDDPADGGTGWLVLEVRDGTGGVMEAYTHGLDLSGTLEGAGGIGGILSVTHPSATNAAYFYHYDGNGNVVRLTDTNGAGVSTLDYEPFGRVLASPGPYTPRYQFSTKEYDGVVGLNYYGYRFYSTTLGRWLNRDPIGDEAFLRQQIQGLDRKNARKQEKHLRKAALKPLFLYVDNNPVSEIDPLGLDNPGGGGQTKCVAQQVLVVVMVLASIVLPVRMRLVQMFSSSYLKTASMGAMMLAGGTPSVIAWLPARVSELVERIALDASGTDERIPTTQQDNRIWLTTKWVTAYRGVAGMVVRMLGRMVNSPVKGILVPLHNDRRYSW